MKSISHKKISWFFQLHHYCGEYLLKPEVPNWGIATPWCDIARTSQAYICHQARNQLGTPGGPRSFWEGPKFFKLCPIILNYVQHIFPGGGKKFCRVDFARPAPPLVTGLPIITTKITGFFEKLFKPNRCECKVNCKKSKAMPAVT